MACAFDLTMCYIVYSEYYYLERVLHKIMELNMKKTNKGFVVHVEGEGSDEVLNKLVSLKRYWVWADKLKDQYYLYHSQEERNINLKKADVFRRDSVMFLIFYFSVTSQVIKSFEEEPKIILSAELKDLKEKLAFNMPKVGEGLCFPGRRVYNEKMIEDLLKDFNINAVNMFHVSMGYFLDKKIQELKNKDFFPYALNK